LRMKNADADVHPV